MSGSDEAEIAKWLAHKGATKCPPKAARELGETVARLAPQVERKAERSQSERASKRQQRALRQRDGFSDEKTKG